MQPCPWSQGRLKKLGDCIRDGTPIPHDVPTYGEVMLWYNDIAASVQRQILAIDWSPLLGDRIPEVTSRPKTIDTLRQKLIREHHMNLPGMQDIAGVRFDAEMTLGEQDGVVAAIAGLFKHDPSTCVRDIRAQPHSGYRGVHVHLRLPGRAEVQVRTHLQSEWANMYEAAGDFLGRGIRYNETITDPKIAALVSSLQDLSTKQIAQLELLANHVQVLEMSIHESIRSHRISDSAESVRSFQDRKRQLGVLQKRQKYSEPRVRTGLTDLRYAFETARQNGSVI
jgi:ppGpp synthetase/RelA/SpoT-type nucleotidyltranferase